MEYDIMTVLLIKADISGFKWFIELGTLGFREDLNNGVKMFLVLLNMRIRTLYLNVEPRKNIALYQVVFFWAEVNMNVYNEVIY